MRETLDEIKLSNTLILDFQPWELWKRICVVWVTPACGILLQNSVLFLYPVNTHLWYSPLLLTSVSGPPSSWNMEGSDFPAPGVRSVYVTHFCQGNASDSDTCHFQVTAIRRSSPVLCDFSSSAVTVRELVLTWRCHSIRATNTAGTAVLQTSPGPAVSLSDQEINFCHVKSLRSSVYCWNTTSSFWPGTVCICISLPRECKSHRVGPWLLCPSLYHKWPTHYLVHSSCLVEFCRMIECGSTPNNAQDKTWYCSCWVNGSQTKHNWKEVGLLPMNADSSPTHCHPRCPP